ncbi:MAG: Txe/YoeB family addiction module toxin [Saprospiraceae bacterium]|nr:Txe/YoeB family addiction module toxin [Saprospiraceae bacterium]
MGKYFIEIKETAQKEMKQIQKSGDKATIKKLELILVELENHPTTGTGKPEQLKHELSGYWSRRLNKKDRLIYQILEKEVIVVIVSALDHY